MDLFIKNIREKDCVCDALVLPFTEGDPGLYDHLGKEFQNIRKTVFSREFNGKPNELLLVPAPAGLKPDRLLFTGFGKKEEITPEKIRQAGGKAAAYLRDTGMKKVALSTALFNSVGASPALFCEGALLGSYSYRKYMKEKNKRLESMTILAKPSNELGRAAREVEKLAAAVHFARDLVNTPSNDMTPSDLAKAALSLRTKKLSVRIIEKAEAQKLGMNSYLSVAKGSAQPPKFIVLEYRGGKGAPVALIGKSVTFDSGGISIKPSDGMEKMKYDMAGGAAVLGVMKFLSESGSEANVVAVLPATENLPGGSAVKPGDVVRAMNGTTIEIISTDAEGRMTLADGIGYAKKFKPAVIIDIATLTGACSIALGSEAVAMMGKNRKALDALKKSSELTSERVWEMPLFDEYKEYLKSDIADLKNTGGRSGSLVASASFLSEFAGDTPWVHLDIAGTAWIEKERPYIPKGASGIGVRLLVNAIKELH